MTNYYESDLVSVGFGIRALNRGSFYKEAVFRGAADVSRRYLPVFTLQQQKYCRAGNGLSRFVEKDNNLSVSILIQAAGRGGCRQGRTYQTVSTKGVLDSRYLSTQPRVRIQIPIQVWCPPTGTQRTRRHGRSVFGRPAQ